MRCYSICIICIYPIAHSIQAEKTQHEQVDQLIVILGKRADSTFDLFCEVVKEVNPDVFNALTGGPGRIVITEWAIKVHFSFKI